MLSRGPQIPTRPSSATWGAYDSAASACPRLPLPTTGTDAERASPTRGFGSAAWLSPPLPVSPSRPATPRPTGLRPRRAGPKRGGAVPPSSPIASLPVDRRSPRLPSIAAVALDQGEQSPAFRGVLAGGNFRCCKNPPPRRRIVLNCADLCQLRSESCAGRRSGDAY